MLTNSQTLGVAASDTCTRVAVGPLIGLRHSSPPHDLRWSANVGGSLVCSSCGYDNPRGHRYCGMCGTPFPHRPLTVPEAQSTLSFSSAPLEVVPAPLQIHTVEPPPVVPPLSTEPIEVEQLDVQPVEPAREYTAVLEREQPTEIEPAVAGAVEAEAVTPLGESTVLEAASVVETVDRAPAVPEPAVEIAGPTLPDREESAPVAEKPPLDAPRAAEAAAVEHAVEAPQVEPAIPTEAAPLSPSIAEPAEPVLLLREKPAPPAEEPVPEALRAAEAATVEPPIEPPAPPTPPSEALPLTPAIAEPAPAELDYPREEVHARTPEVHEPAPPQLHVVVTPRPGPRIVPKPARSRRETRPARTEIQPRRPAAAHPSPDALLITPPPDSAGMPKFQSVAEAPGPPAFSPFEPPAEKHTDEDQELKEFVVNVRYMPPDETADELTMHSEVPVYDDQEPAEFHHASFDGDVPPPPEARAHPTGNEYYPVDTGSTNRSRFLDIAERTQSGASDQRPPSATGPSFLGLDNPSPVPSALDEAAPPSRSHALLWSVLAIVAIIFGVLGFLEGRAQITHAFRGPVEIVRERFVTLRMRVMQLTASAPAAVPTAAAPESDKKPASPSPPAANQAPANPSPGPNGAPSTESSAAPTAAPANSEAQTQPSPPAAQQATPPADRNSGAATSTNMAKDEPPKSIEAPPPKPPTKHHPGQQELAKALDASDSAAAAAWLWKATSRGNPDAPVRLADMYIKGKGVPRSCEQALVLLRSAAIKENAPARNRLAALYANGTCVARDPVRAYQLLSSALEADPTSDWAEQTRKDLWNRMTPEERAEAQKSQ